MQNRLTTVPKQASARHNWLLVAGVIALGRRLSGKKSARGADLGTSQSLLRVEHYGLRDRQMAVIESCSEVED